MKNLFITIFVFSTLFSVSFSQETIKVAALFSKTGEASSISDEHLITVRFAVEEINRNGGILSKKVELIEIDNESTALGSRKAALLASQEDIIAVFGGSWSSHALGMAPVLQQKGIPMLTPTATNPKVTEIGNYIFRVCFVDTFQGQILAKFAHEVLKSEKLAVLTNTDQIYSIGLSDTFIEHSNFLNKNIVAKLTYIENMANYKKLISNLKQFDVDTVMLPGYTRDSAQIIKLARNAGIKSIFIGGDGWSHLMLNYTQKELNNTYYLTHWHKDMTDKKSKKFVNKIVTVFDKSRINAGMALSYDMVYLLKHAIVKANTLEKDKIRTALSQTKQFVGVTGNIKFDSFGNPVKPAVILKFNNGKSTVVKRIEP